MVNRPPPVKRVHSRSRDYEVKGTLSEVVTKYEGLAYQAQREERYADAHYLFQHADHYKRVENGQQ